MNKRCGIYKIRNVVNNKIYVGSAMNIGTRWRKHIYELNNNTHRNAHLQKAWDKYGEANFEFSIVEECIEETLLIREDVWMKYHDSLNPLKGYNLRTAERHIMSEESKRKISEANRGKKHPMSEETKKKLSKANKGQKRSIEVIKKMSKAQLLSRQGQPKRHTSEETRRKISEAKQLVSEETRRKISEKLKGRIFSKEARMKLSQAHTGVTLSKEHINKIQEGKSKAKKSRLQFNMCPK